VISCLLRPDDRWLTYSATPHADHLISTGAEKHSRNLKTARKSSERVLKEVFKFWEQRNSSPPKDGAISRAGIALRAAASLEVPPLGLAPKSLRKNTRKMATPSTASPGSVKPTILAFHGSGSNATIHTVQLARIMRVVKPHFNVEALEGVFALLLLLPVPRRLTPTQRPSPATPVQASSPSSTAAARLSGGCRVALRLKI
jgi:hypothetical protein